MSTRTGHDPLAALRVPAFRAYAASRVAAGVAMTMVQATIAWQVYEISGSALQLGMIGLVRFVPALLASLLGGAVADTYNRRTVILLSQIVPLLATVVLVGATAAGTMTLPVLYAIVLITGLASAFENPARQALLPIIVPREVFTNAITVNSTLQSLAFMSGPAIGGIILAVFGVAEAYALHGVLVAASMVALLAVSASHVSTGARVSIAMIREGVVFVGRAPVLLGAMSLDMFAVLFGGAKALLPVYAVDILQVGEVGYGILSASLEAGAMLMALVLLLMRPITRTGRVLLLSVAAFGVATILFGLSRNFAFSVFAYMLVGMADQLSVVMRHATIQLATPDELRGRVSAVNSVFISASNQLGMVESGFVAALTSATFAVVSGGFGCLAIVALIAWRVPSLRRYRIDTTTPAPRPAGEPATAEAAS
ncbi:MAG: MFS transporter [Chloroflexota bacterium]